MSSTNKWADLSAEPKYLLSEEAARDILKSICLFYEVDLVNIPEDQQKAADLVLDRLVNAFRTGRLETKEDDKLGLCLVQNLRNGETLTFKEFRGDLKPRVEAMASDDAPHKRIHALAGLMCGLGSDAIAKLSVPDLRVAEGVATFFFVFC
jgi:hypothetical protein